MTFWNCGAQSDVRPSSTVPSCPAGPMTALRLHVTFPSCWNGRSKDSADHQSHAAYPRRGQCPTHPVAVPALSLILRYPAIAPGASVELSSVGQFSAHADFFNAWNQGEPRTARRRLPERAQALRPRHVTRRGRASGSATCAGPTARPRSERDGHVARLAVASDGQLQLVARLVLGDRAAKLVAGVDRLALDLDDHVARLEPGVVGRAAVGDLGERGTVVRVGEANAEVRPLDRLTGLERPTTSCTVSIGTAYPIPTLPPVSVAICELIPTTRPWPSSSGPRCCRG